MEKRIDTLPLPVTAERATTLALDFYDVAKPQNFVPHRLLTSVTASVAEGARRWLDVPVGLHSASPSSSSALRRASLCTAAPNR